MDDVKDKQPEKKIYCGPNLPGLSQFAVVTGIPNLLSLHIAACGAIEKLLVPIKEINHTRLKLAVKGSYQQQQYIKIEKYIRGIKDERL